MSDRQPASQPTGAWWQEEVLYHVYLRSFADANGDGVGDLAGLRQHLDHFEWLDVGAIWLSPIHPSPNCDWGYDVADYFDVHRDFGDLADVDALISDAAARGIRVLLDLVPNHTSSDHRWFQASRSDRTSRYRDWYVWRDGRDGATPNNWINNVRAPAWTPDGNSDQWYLHNYFPGQPDLNWWNEEVRAEFDRIIAFWLERGVAGFRIDVAHGIVKDALLRDNPPATVFDTVRVQALGQRQARNIMQPGVHDVLRRWRRLADAYGSRVLLGETCVFDTESVAGFYGDGDELHLCQNFLLPEAPFDAGALRAIVEAAEVLYPDGAWPVWFLSNHDMSRVPTRWCNGDDRRTRCALLLLLCLRGTPILYYGDELGLPDSTIAPGAWRDPVAERFPPGRDVARGPMSWDASDGRGFTAPGVAPWLPFAPDGARNVAAQHDDPRSLLHATRELIALRRRTPDLLRGGYASLPSPPLTWAWRRGSSTVVVLNLSDDVVTAAMPAGSRASSTVTYSTDTDAIPAATQVSTSISLAPWSGVVVATPS